MRARVCVSHTVSDEQMLILNNPTNGPVTPDKLRETVACPEAVGGGPEACISVPRGGCELLKDVQLSKQRLENPSFTSLQISTSQLPTEKVPWGQTARFCFPGTLTLSSESLAPPSFSHLESLGMPK